jgi:CubicO group peptidase (beta-lactamase class C family)
MVRFPKLTSVIICLCGICLILGACNKPDDGVVTLSELNDELDKEFSKQDMTSLAYAVVKNDQLLLANAMGMANEELGTPATANTRYLIASVSKTVTAVALLQLYERGLFSLDEDINRYLPFSVRNPNYPTDSITFRMLLSHTSSISDKYQETLDLYCWGVDCPLSLADYCRNVFTNDNRDFYSEDNFSSAAPGEKEEYSNTAFALAGYLVEYISGELFYTYCEQAIFDPLGMDKTEWRLGFCPTAELAVPYSSDITFINHQYTFPDYPNGGLRTTVKDMSVFLRAIIGGGSYAGVTLLSPVTVAEMKSLQMGSSSQCMAFYYDTYDGIDVLGHNGGEMGVSTDMFMNPENNVGAIVFNNDDDTDLRKVVALLLRYGAGN